MYFESLSIYMYFESIYILDLFAVEAVVQGEFIGNDVVGATELNPLEARSLVPVVHAPDICIIFILCTTIITTVTTTIITTTELNPLEPRSLVPVVHAPDICIILIYIILEKLFFLDICIILIYIMLEKKTFLPTRH